MKTKVLTIDDEVGFTRLLKMNLEKGGQYEVMIENDSNQALNTALSFQPDVILLDIVMPGMDGGDVAALFKEHEVLKNVPIIMMTALMSPSETDSDGFSMSSSELILPKPVNMDALVECLEKALHPRQV